MKTAKDYLDAAKAAVPTMDAQDAIAKHKAGQGAFIDVRDSADIAKSGTIAGAHRIPRGMIEFRADPQMEAFHDPVFQKDAELYLICGAGRAGGVVRQDAAGHGLYQRHEHRRFPRVERCGRPRRKLNCAVRHAKSEPVGQPEQHIERVAIRAKDGIRVVSEVGPVDGEVPHLAIRRDRIGKPGLRACHDVTAGAWRSLNSRSPPLLSVSKSVSVMAPRPLARRDRALRALQKHQRQPRMRGPEGQPPRPRQPGPKSRAPAG